MRLEMIMYSRRERCTLGRDDQMDELLGNFKSWSGRVNTMTNMCESIYENKKDSVQSMLHDGGLYYQVDG